MRPLFCVFSLVGAGVWGAWLAANAQGNVTQDHNNLSRDGLYIDSAFTPAAAAALTRDLNFNGTISGNVYAQPLYTEGGPNGAIDFGCAGIDQYLCAHRHYRYRVLEPQRRPACYFRSSVRQHQP